jgi:hypothetical protein
MGHNAGQNGRRKKNFLYNHLHILLDHLCKFERNPLVNEELMPQDLITEINKGL